MMAESEGLTKTASNQAKAESLGSHRRLTGLHRVMVLILCISGVMLAIIQLFFLLAPFGLSVYEISYLYGLVAAFFPPIFLLYPATKNSSTDAVPWYDTLLCFISLGCLLYFTAHGYTIYIEGWMFETPRLPMILGMILLALIMEAARRTTGKVFFVFCLFFLLFPMFAPYIPAPFTGLGFSFAQTVSLHSMGSESLLGLPMKVVGNILIGFMIFGVAMTITGGGAFFLNFSMALMGHTRGGPAKVAVIASALFGSLSGSVVSNVLTTGSVTIPAIKRIGYEPHYAGAIETCASTGGVLMPPIMGATAFVMAMFLDIPYLYIAVAALIPSILYFFGLLVQVDAYAAKNGLSGLPRSELPSLGRTMKEGWFFIFPIFLLIWIVAYLRLEAQAPFYTTGVLFVFAAFRKETRPTLSTLMQFIEGTAKLMAELTSILTGVSVMIGALIMTGVSSAFASEVIRLAGGNLPLLLFLAAFTSLLLGTGMTITACYVFLALMVAPVLVEMGLNVLAVHLFILYYGMLSFITPPVAIGAFAAASIARALPMRTAFCAMRLGTVKYLIPFFIVINPAMVLQSKSVGEILYVVMTGILGVWLIGAALEGYVLYLGKIGWIARCAIFASGILIAVPEVRTDIYGAVIMIATLIVFLLMRKPVKRSGTKGNGGMGAGAK